jgi:hypothetical protein
MTDAERMIFACEYVRAFSLWRERGDLHAVHTALSSAARVVVELRASYGKQGFDLRTARVIAEFFGDSAGYVG